MPRPKYTSIHTADVTGRVIEGTEPGAELVEESLFRILEDNVLCSMATVTPDSRPHIHTAYFSYSESLELYLLSHPGSLHCRNLSKNSSMAMAVFSSVQQWTGPDLGVQLFGTCERADGASAEEAERSYANRFPAYGAWKATLARGDPAREYRLYRFRVTELKILDDATFGDAVFVRASVERE